MAVQRTTGRHTAGAAPVPSTPARVAKQMISRSQKTPYSRPNPKSKKSGNQISDGPAFISLAKTTPLSHTGNANSGGLFGFLSEAASKFFHNFGRAGPGSDPFQVPWKAEENEIRELRKELNKEKAKAEKAQARIDASLRATTNTQAQPEKDNNDTQPKVISDQKEDNSADKANGNDDAEEVEMEEDNNTNMMDQDEIDEGGQAANTSNDENVAGQDQKEAQKAVSTPKKGTEPQNASAHVADGASDDDHETAAPIKSANASPSVFEIALKSRAKFGLSPKSTVKLTPKTPTSQPGSVSKSNVRQHRWFWESQAAAAAAAAAAGESTSSPTSESKLRSLGKEKDKSNQQDSGSFPDLGPSPVIDQGEETENDAERPTSTNQSQQKPPLPSKSLSSLSMRVPHVPATFADLVSKATTSQGKRRRIPSQPASAATPANKGGSFSNGSDALGPDPRHSISSLSAGSEPSPTAKRLLSHAMFTPSQPLRISSEPGTNGGGASARNRSASALMTAALRRRKRRASTAYYGTGYTSRSAPYRSSTISSSSLRPTLSESNTGSHHSVPAVAAAHIDVEDNAESSITARKILDIISELPPVGSAASSSQRTPAKSVVNPYELSSPYKVKLGSQPTPQKQLPRNKRISMVFADDNTDSPSGGSSSESYKKRRNTTVLSMLERTAPREIKSKQKPKADSQSTGSAAPKQPASKKHVTPAHVLLFAAKKQASGSFDNNTNDGVEKPNTSMAISKDLPPWAQPKSSTIEEAKISSTNSNNGSGSLFGGSFSFGSSSSTTATAAATAASTGGSGVSLNEKQKESIFTNSKTTTTNESTSSKPFSFSQTSVSSNKTEDDAAAPPISSSIFKLTTQPTNISTPSSSAKTIPLMSTTSELAAPPTTSETTNITNSAVTASSLKDLVSKMPSSELPVFRFKTPTKSKAVSQIDVLGGTNMSIDVSKLPSFTFGGSKIQSSSSVEEEKSKAKESMGGSSPGFSFANSPLASMLALKPGQWKCKLCDSPNPPEATAKCTVCEEPKPGSKSESSTTTTAQTSATKSGSGNASTTSSGFTFANSPLANMLALKPGQWKCKLCDSPNPPEATVKCNVCEEPKPGATTTSAGFGTAPPSSFGSTAGGGFGGAGGFKPTVSIPVDSTKGANSTTTTPSSLFGSGGSGGFKPTFGSGSSSLLFSNNGNSSSGFNFGGGGGGGNSNNS
ncbi:hypothetical protein H4219_003744 [Mycoemilia scoparia]|uniref:RanBP2-type domain-containing protein n=1 Tax=Mycoemilia scoparia TaxID=417184 RepID=A0A9W7ZZE3_9FUNG|nr:hypothetical protein H4219_003744 [Mycoemilia scoparia]